MLVEAEGNLLDAAADALVNTVNTVGVMGKGLALQFKQAYPANYRAYTEARSPARRPAGPARQPRRPARVPWR